MKNTRRERGRPEIDEIIRMESWKMLSFIYSEFVIDWAMEDCQADLRSEIVAFDAKIPERSPDLPIMALKAAILGRLKAPPDADDRERSGWACLLRIIEAGTAVIDWEFVVSGILKNHIQGGK